MGQRTQIVVVEDVINEAENSGYRFVTAHHDQWGFGRPVIFDLLYLTSKIATGSYLCPRDYDASKEIGAYPFRQLLHHSFPLKDEVDGKLIPLDLNGKGNDEANKTASDFISMFDMFDNNNGGAVLWIVHYQLSNYHTQTSVAYGCLLGGEDSENPFSGYVDAVTYLKRTNSQLATKDFLSLVRSSFKYMDVTLLDENETVKNILPKEVL